MQDFFGSIGTAVEGGPGERDELFAVDDCTPQAPCKDTGWDIARLRS